MPLPDTVKTQLDTAISLFEDVSETLLRCDGRLEEITSTMQNLATKPGVHSPTFESMTSDAQELRMVLINLRQQVEKSVTNDLGPITQTLNYLHQDGIPNLTEQVRNLNVTISALQTSLPVLKSLADSIAPMKADTEAAGKFARHFQEPMRELLGRTSEGSIDEGKNILRNMAQVIFDLSGRDKSGVEDKDRINRLEAFLTHYFKKNFMSAEGEEKEKFFQFWDALWDYCTSEIWHRIFDVVLAILVWLFILNPAGRSLQGFEAQAETTIRALQTIMQTKR